MTKKYVVVDVEASGPTPANYSMLSLGACVIGQPEKTFYREVSPLIFKRYSTEAMKVGCKGLRCLEELRKKDLNYDIGSSLFSPDLVLKLLEETGESPSRAMEGFGKWITNNVTEGERPVLASDCLGFDGMWIHHYFDHSGIENPFGYGGEDLNDMYRGFVRDPNASIEESEFWPGDLSHNVMEDARVIAIAGQKLFDAMKGESK